MIFQSGYPFKTVKTEILLHQKIANGCQSLCYHMFAYNI